MFCENCGRQLQDGEVCTCTQQAPAVNEQPAPETQAPAAPQPQYYQPQPQPAYQPTPAPAPAPAPAYQPAPAPQPAPQPQAYQPQTQPAPQPVYQQPAPQPAYQQTQPAYQPVYQPVAKPVAERAYSYGKPRYNLTAQFLASPTILVFGILYAFSILFQLISVATSFSVSSVFTLIFILLDSMVAIGAFISWASAKSYMSKGTPISPAGLTMASGLFKAYGIVFIVISSIITLLVLIACGMAHSAYPMITLLVPVTLVFFKVAFYFSLSNAFKSIRHEIANNHYGSGISLYPVVIKCISTAFQVISIIITLVLVSSASGIYGILNESGALRELRRELGRDVYDTVMSFILPSSGAVAISIIVSLVGLAISVLAIIILIKARQTKAQTYSMKE